MHNYLSFFRCYANICWSKVKCFLKQLWCNWGIKINYVKAIKLMNEFWFLLGMLSNHCNAALVFFHCCTPVFGLLLYWFFLGLICLLVLILRDFEGFMRRQVGLFAKLSLWSFKVITQHVDCIFSCQEDLKSCRILKLPEGSTSRLSWIWKALNATILINNRQPISFATIRLLV